MATKIKIIRCKNCKYYCADYWGVIDNMPIIIAHEICSRWGSGCKTEPLGYCHLAEHKTESEGNNE